MVHHKKAKTLYQLFSNRVKGREIPDLYKKFIEILRSLGKVNGSSTCIMPKWAKGESLCTSKKEANKR